MPLFDSALDRRWLRAALSAVPWPTEDVIGRLDGEEFLALLPDTPAEAAARADEALCAAKAEGRDRVRGPATLPRRT